jgi:hypothetical protein
LEISDRTVLVKFGLGRLVSEPRIVVYSNLARVILASLAVDPISSVLLPKVKASSPGSTRVLIRSLTDSNLFDLFKEDAKLPSAGITGNWLMYHIGDVHRSLPLASPQAACSTIVGPWIRVLI